MGLLGNKEEKRAEDVAAKAEVDRLLALPVAAAESRWPGRTQGPQHRRLDGELGRRLGGVDVMNRTHSKAGIGGGSGR
jgi:hypothetical protein